MFGAGEQSGASQLHRTRSDEVVTEAHGIEADASGSAALISSQPSN